MNSRINITSKIYNGSSWMIRGEINLSSSGVKFLGEPILLDGI